MNKLLLYSSCFCRLILISFNFWSVVRVVSGKINFTALLCREFNLFLRTERERVRERARETQRERERERERETERERDCV